MKPKQEPLVIKAATLLSLGQTASSVTGNIGGSKIEVQHCSIACMQNIKATKGVTKFEELNPGSNDAQQLDKIPTDLKLDSVKCQSAADLATATTDASSQQISISAP